MDTERIMWLNQPTRHRMLEAAEQWFADVGYELSRVDDIASTAQVSKSHLYYHFPSKLALMSALVELRQAELLASKDEILNSLTGQSLGGDLGELTEVLRQLLTKTLQPRRRFIRIVLIETLKNSEEVEPIIASFNRMLQDTVDRFGKLGIPLEPARAKTLLFHFALIPALFAVALDSSRIGLDVEIADLIGEVAIAEQNLIQMLLRRTS